MSDSGEGDNSEELHKQDVKEEGAAGNTEEEDGDAEIEAMKKRVKELEEVARQLSTTGKKTAEEVNNGPDVDSRSVYVGNVDYSSTPEELQEFFSACGTVNRVTILCDKFTGHPKGFAYVEFKDQDAVVNAVILNESEFKGRQLKITPKRTNIHGFNPGGRGGRGRGGRGAPRGGRGGYYPPPYGYPPPPPHAFGYDAGYGYAPAPRGRFHNRRGTFAPY